MLKGAHDIFVVIVNFIFNYWEAKYVIIGRFEVIDTSGIALAPKLQELSDKFTLIEKIVIYVNGEGSDLQIGASALNSIVSCSTLGLLELQLMAHVLDMHFQRCASMPHYR
jgi:hypothetical protein